MTLHRLHELTHRIPGVPAHDDRGATARRRPQGVGRHPRRAQPTSHHAREPRVFVRWQGWIASLVNRGDE
ncbi:hypothetical protein [Microbacterium sp. SS28]|uniref:hypothetical protein n=1 Tax=Microbacterium sp. SS28 TaxID=2919948 RepID=UPI001FA9C2DC|nr:hypothetical protein [Microbacterium sp. SS28]